MKKLIEFDSSRGIIFVESGEGPDADSVIRGGGFSGIAEKVGKSFDEAVGIVRPIAELTIAQLKGMAHAAETVEIEFGLKFSASAGAIIAVTGAEGNLRIKIVWKPDREIPTPQAGA